MENEDLFCSDKLQKLFNRIKKNISKDIKYYNVHKQLKDKEEEITDKIFMRYKINAPHLNEDDMYQVNDDNAPVPLSKISKDEKLKIRTGEHCTFVVPFTGDFELFYLQPSNDISEICKGVVTKDKLLINYEVSDESSTKNIMENFSNNISAAKRILNCIHSESEEFNMKLHEYIKTEIKRIKQKNAAEDSFLSVA